MTKQRRIMEKFRIDELSAVDIPAQEGATMLIMKRLSKRMPKPKEGESQKDFVARFMGDKTMGEDYPDQKQRLAIAYKLHGGTQKHKDKGEADEDPEEEMSESDEEEAAEQDQEKPRAKKALDIFKRACLLSDEDGHSHLIYDDAESGGMTSYGETMDEEAAEAAGTRAGGNEGEVELQHCHPWAKDDSGQIVVGMAAGHTHDVVSGAFKAAFTADERKKLAESGAAMPDGSFPIRNKEDLSNALHAQGRASNPAKARAHIKARARALGLESELPDSFGETKKSANSQGDEEMELTELQKRIASLEAELAEANKIAKMSDAEKSAAQDATNPVVFTSESGATFRKNDDQRLVKMAQENDRLAKEGRESLEREQVALFSKRASEELASLPGEPLAKVALLRAVAGIKDEALRGKAEAILKAHNRGMAKAFERVGTSVIPNDSGSPVEQLEALAKRYAEDKKVPILKARDEVLKTDEGKKLYEQTIGVGKGV